MSAYLLSLGFVGKLALLVLCVSVLFCTVTYLATEAFVANWRKGKKRKVRHG